MPSLNNTYYRVKVTGLFFNIIIFYFSDLHSCAWMMTLIHIPQTLIGYMGIYLCRRDITVPEQHLYDTQVSTMIQQVRRKSVP